MDSIAVVGDRDSVLGFKAAGFRVVSTEDPQKAGDAVKRLADEGYAVVFVTEDLSEKMTDIFERYRERRIPAIIPVPGNRGGTGFSMRQIKSAVERAVGADILKEE